MSQPTDEMARAFVEADKATRRAEFERLGFNLHLPTLNVKALDAALAAALDVIAVDVRTLLAPTTTRHLHGFPWRPTDAPCEQCAARERLAQIFPDQDGGS